MPDTVKTVQQHIQVIRPFDAKVAKTVQQHIQVILRLDTPLVSLNICGITPAKVNGLAVASVAKVCGK